VAATRARDLLVVPAIGDEPFDGGWLSPLNEALYPPLEDRQSPKQAVGCPPFKGKDTVLERPDGEQPGIATMRPGQYDIVDPGSNERVSVVWWDPLLLEGTGDDTRGLRRDDLISKEARPEDVAADRARYDAWFAARASAKEMGAQPSLLVMTATEWAHAAGDGFGPEGVAPFDSHLLARARPGFSPVEVFIEDAGLAGPRPSGKRFGVLVHALLAAVPLDADADQIDALARLHAKVIGAPDEERDEAARIVDRLLRHRVLKAAREAPICRREAPVSIVIDDVLVDGQVDLAFETGEGWTVVDFKTDAEIGGADEVYRRQVGLYAQAIARVTGRPSRGVLLRV
jgi:ATP-dependent helicase/nuclease subunit A